MRTRLTKVILDEVSLVDRGANQHAAILIAKREEEVCKCGDTPCDKCKLKQQLAKEEEEIEKVGIEFAVCTNEDGESVLHKVFFSPDVQTAEAIDWLSKHNLPFASSFKDGQRLEMCTEVSKSELNNLRTFLPGTEILKALRAKLSLSQISNTIERALRDKFQTKEEQNSVGHYLWVRDLYRNTVVFDQEGQPYRADYTLDVSGREPVVAFSERIPVEVVYQDLVMKSSVPPVLVSKEVKVRVDALRLRSLSLTA